MPDLPQEQPQSAAPQQPEPKSKGDESREAREASFAKRQKAARERSKPLADEPKPEAKLAPDADDQPTSKPAPEPEKSAEEKPKSSEVDKRHAIAERRERRVAARESKIETRESAVDKRERDLAARFGDPEAAVKEYEAKNYHAAAKYMQNVFKDDFATITQKIARHTAGLSPEKLKELEERDNFTREKREFEAQKERERKAADEGVTREQAVKTCAAKCAGHDVLKLRNGPDLVLRELEASWDTERKGFRLTFKQAADKVVADKLAEAEALGARRAQAKLEEKPQPKVEEKPVQRRVVRHAEPKPKDGKRLSFEERHALAGRVTARRLR